MGMLRGFLTVALLFAAAGAKAVVGGITATSGDVPGQVALVDLSRATGIDSCLSSGGTEYFCKQYCSGVLIAPQWVLTAAHCATDIAAPDITKLRVVAGTTSVDQAADTGTRVVAKVVHSGYRGSPDNISNNIADIALLKLDAPLAVPLASLAEIDAEATLLDTGNTTGGYPYLDDEVMASGWGRLTSAGKFPVDLQRVRLDIQSDDYCLLRYTAVNFTVGAMLCAAELESAEIEDDDVGDLTPRDPDGEGICSYDSGGPLTFEANGFQQVAGLTSFADASKCGQAEFPGAFTRITHYLGWLESQSTGSASFGDLSVSFSGARGATPGGTISVTVTLKNQSTASGVTGAGFVLNVPGELSVSQGFVPLDMTCGPVAGGRSCTMPGTLDAGGVRQVVFEFTPVSASASLSVTVEAVTNAAAREDYRTANDSARRRLLFSESPDLAVEIDGYVQEIVGSTGTAWIVGRVINRAWHKSASNVQLGVTLSPGTQIEADSWEGVSCTGVTCPIGSLLPGEERRFRLRVISPGAWSRDVVFAASMTEEDFPAMVDGVSDSSATVAITFNAIHGSSGGTSSGGGSIDMLLFALLASLGLRPPRL